jgi:hypothetical protein
MKPHPPQRPARTKPNTCRRGKRTANLAQAQPSPWGWVMAATPCLAFLVAVSMLERRAARHGPAAGVLAVRGREGYSDGPSGQGRLPSAPGDGQDSQDGDEDGGLPALARRAAAEHLRQHGQPITRDALRARLGVSNQAASDLLRQIRLGEGRYPPGPSQAA